MKVIMMMIILTSMEIILLSGDLAGRRTLNVDLLTD